MEISSNSLNQFGYPSWDNKNENRFETYDSGDPKPVSQLILQDPRKHQLVMKQLTCTGMDKVIYFDSTTINGGRL